MNYLKNSLRLKITVFLLITALIFWLIPSNLIFGEEGGGDETVLEGGEVVPPVDTTAPVITLNGDNPATIEVGAGYSDAGAVAVDDIDGEIPITGESNVDTTIAGSYTVIYNFSDAAGNAAVEVVRAVNVIDPTVPPEEETPLVEETQPEEPVLNPVVSTDLADYGPGDIVIVTGSGWQPGETVTLNFVALPLNAVVDYTAEADSAGNISNTDFIIYEYHLDATIILTATGQTSGLSAITMFTDHPQSNGEIDVEKDVRNSSGGNVGDNHHFTVRLWVSDTEFGTYTEIGFKVVAEDHDAEWDDLLTYKWYKVTEDTETGYTLHSITSPQYLSDNDDDEFEVENWRNPTYSVTVNKSGLLSWYVGPNWWNYEWDSAIFTLTGPSGTVGSATLDNINPGGNPSSVTWSNLPAGSYTLTESFPASNDNDYTATYTLGGGPSSSFPVGGLTFTLDSNKTFNIVNTAGPTTGTVIIHKDVQTPTGGAISDPTPTFHYNIDGAAAQDIHDGDAITISGVTAGSHYVEETGTIPTGYSFYSISSTPAGTPSGQRVTFTVTSGGTTDVYITNRQNTGTVIVQKIVKNFSGDVVDDDTSFNVTVGTQTLSFSQDSPRSFTVNPGTYSAVETTPTNYNIINNTGSVTVSPGETETITITNQQKEGHITINKYGLQDAGNSSNDYSEFKLYQGGVQVPGTATVVLDNLASALRPDTFTWDGLDWGTYTIVEEYGASNYYTYTISYDPSDTAVIGAGNLNKTVNINNKDPQIKTGEITIHKTVIGTAKDSDFVFTVDDGVNTPYTVNISGSGGDSSSITVEAGKTYTITENDPGACWDTAWTTTIPGATDVPGGITFFVDGDNIGRIDEESVTFTNTRKSATITIEKDVIGPVLAADIFNFTATGMTPFALADGGSVNMTIECGLEYTVTETLPNTNWLSDIADDGKIEIVSETANSITFKGTQNVNEDLQDSTITFTNTRKSGTVGVTKAIMDSLTLISYAPTYGTFSFGWSASDGTSDTFDLTSPGYLNTIAVWCGIDYTIGETSTDPELEIVTDPITFTAAEGDNGTWTFYNKTGSITVLKVDETDGKALEGSTLRLFEADGTTPAIDAFGNPVGDQVTDSDGKAYFTKLAFRTYIVEEISAPTGYSLAGPIDVPVDGDPGNDVSIVMKDPRIPGKVTIIKTDPAGTPLDGVGFTIYYKVSGNPVMPERFTSSGMVTFDGLEWGSYTIAETTPPPGYDTSDPVDVIIDASNAESGVTVNRINTPTTTTTTTTTITTLGITSPVIEVLGITELPFTGLDPIIPISGISTIIAGGLMVALSTIRKRFGKK